MVGVFNWKKKQKGNKKMLVISFCNGKMVGVKERTKSERVVRVEVTNLFFLQRAWSL